MRVCVAIIEIVCMVIINSMRVCVAIIEVRTLFLAGVFLRVGRSEFQAIPREILSSSFLSAAAQCSLRCLHFYLAALAGASPMHGFLASQASRLLYFVLSASNS